LIYVRVRTALSDELTLNSSTILLYV